jgi:DNA helicase-2/ATP-dependent DNA helicase PcrA
MTLHSAKGLEFPIVFMVGLEEGLFPSNRAFDKMDQMEEERRLCYVGMTRAKDRLIMSSASVRMLFGQSHAALVSRFIGEIPNTLLMNRNPSNSKAKRKEKSETFLAKAKGMSPKRYNITPKITDKLETANVGMQVKHKVFGKGMVVAVDGTRLTIAFENNGIKKLDIVYAPLQEV